MPTLAEMRKTHPDDADALGELDSIQRLHNARQVRTYAASRDERAVLVKTGRTLVLRHMMQFQAALDWGT